MICHSIRRVVTKISLVGGTRPLSLLYFVANFLTLHTSDAFSALPARITHLATSIVPLSTPRSLSRNGGGISSIALRSSSVPIVMDETKNGKYLDEKQVIFCLVIGL